MFSLVKNDEKYDKNDVNKYKLKYLKKTRVKEVGKN